LSVDGLEDAAEKLSLAAYSGWLAISSASSQTDGAVELVVLGIACAVFVRCARATALGRKFCC
jgi:hypothetical protein